MIKRKLILELVKIKDQRKLILELVKIKDQRKSNKDESLGTKWRD